MTLFRKIAETFGFHDGLCHQFMHAADELVLSAKVLRTDLETYRRAPDPFGALLSTMYNNHEFEKFSDRVVDIGTKPGVQASPIKRAPGPTR